VKTVLPLGEDPPAITSLCFNHNGKILAASSTDGMIHMFGILLLSYSFTITIKLPAFFFFLFLDLASYHPKFLD
jgi:hypothetical protein